MDIVWNKSNPDGSLLDAIRRYLEANDRSPLTLYCSPSLMELIMGLPQFVLIEKSIHVAGTVKICFMRQGFLSMVRTAVFQVPGPGMAGTLILAGTGNTTASITIVE